MWLVFYNSMYFIDLYFGKESWRQVFTKSGEIPKPCSPSRSWPVVQEIHQGGAGDSPGWCRRFTRVVQEIHQGGAGAAPRTSHSFEPVNEPKNIMFEHVRTECEKLLTVTKKPTRHSRKYSGVQACGKPVSATISYVNGV